MDFNSYQGIDVNLEPVAAIEVFHITLPVPPSALSPNASSPGGHWSKKARAVKQYRARAEAEARRIPAGKRPGWERAECRITAYFATKRRRDADNLIASLKSAFDGLADAGVIVNDSGLTVLPPTLALDPTNPRIEMEVRPL